MADSKELTYEEVSGHNSKKDLFVVIHDKIYNASSFIDEHPYVPRSPSSKRAGLPRLPAAFKFS